MQTPVAAHECNRSVKADLTYRPDIDGLRFLAVILVILYHAGSNYFRGGFVGVDVFFVISGYLITSLIVIELDAGRFAIGAFYVRRIKRILPALFLVAAAVMAAGWYLMFPQQYEELGKSVLAVVSFVSNIFFWHTSGGYFANSPEGIPLLHTWSLGVEEQYYILFPVALAIISRWRPGALRPAVGLICVSSFILNMALTPYRSSAAFFLAPTRAWELMIGALLALQILPPIRSVMTRNLSSALGLALIGLAAVTYSASTPFPGLAALAPTIGAALFVWPGNEAVGRANRLLGLRGFAFGGRISYSLYLWHYPLLVLPAMVALRPLTGSEKSAAIAFTVVAAVLSWRFVELPFRRRRDDIPTVFAAASCATLLLAAVALVVIYTDGCSWRVGKDSALILANQRVATTLAYPPECAANSQEDFSGNREVAYCRFTQDNPAGQGRRTVLFWGDSNVEQLYPALARLAASNSLPDRSLLMATSRGCPPIPGLNRMKFGFDCDGFNTKVLARASEPDVGTVFIGASWPLYSGSSTDDAAVCSLDTLSGACVRFKNIDERIAFFRAHLTKTVRGLRQAGKHVVLILPFPYFDVPVARYVMRQLYFGRPLDESIGAEAYRAARGGIREMLIDVARRADAAVLDPLAILCAREECPYVRDGVSRYRDEGHMSVATALELAGALKKALDRNTDR